MNRQYANKSAKPAIVIMIAALVCHSQVLADTVLLKNGDRLTGKVDSISGGRVLLMTEYAGGVAIDVAAIAEMETEDSFDVRVRTEGVKQDLAGQFIVDERGQSIQQEGQEDGAATALELIQVQHAGQNNLALSRFAAEWASRADLSAIISSGNSKTESYNTLLESVRKQGKVEHSLSVLVSREEAEGVTTKDQQDVDYGYKRFFSENWYASGNAEYFKDELKDIDQRFALGAGAGYQFWDNSFGAFSIEMGLSAVDEKLNDENETNHAVRWELNYNRFLFSKRMEIFHNQSILFIPDSARGEVLSSSSGLRYALNGRVDATTRVDVNHETKPPQDSSKTDVTYTVGVGIKF